jgi:HAD superfamily hydrolase (TIGR01484 family)
MGFTMRIEGLFSDYDGTLSPLNVSREDSKVPEEIGKALYRIAGRIPLGIISTKDASFIVPRTPFARAWCTVGGLEVKNLSATFLDDRITSTVFDRFAQALEYSRRQMNGCAVIEEKKDSLGVTLAFCVDWRSSPDRIAAQERINRVVTFCRENKLQVEIYGEQPFLDVFPCPVDKGTALTRLEEIFGINTGIIYMGDSRLDNAAFKIADVSIGIVHPETPPDLKSRYFLDFERLPDFLNGLLNNGLIFSDCLPGIRIFQGGI